MEKNIIEVFDGFVDRIDAENDLAYVSLKSQEYGDELIGEYSAKLLQEKGIDEQRRFICRVVEIDQKTQIELEPVSSIIVSQEKLDEIEKWIDEKLGNDNELQNDY